MISGDIYKKFQDIEFQWDQLQESFPSVEIEKEIKVLRAQSMEPDFWQDSNKAQQIAQKLAYQENKYNTWQEIKDAIDYLSELWHEKESVAEQETELMLQELTSKIEVFETKLLLSDRYDSYNAILSLSVGNGGQDAEDFTALLARMYTRFFEQQGFDFTVVEESATVDGLRSVTYEVRGTMAFGLLKSENGVHRLIRQSPFNAKGLRQTSFARIEVIPEVQQDTEIVLEEKDLRIDVFRSSGSGGQSVNTTDSAVRITYLPLGISVSCQNEKSQLQNKQTALKILKSRLLKLSIEQQAAEVKNLKGDLMENSFGSQIRSYTLHPYKLVKDHRTDYEESSPQKVLEGDLEPFVYAYLKHVNKK